MAFSALVSPFFRAILTGVLYFLGAWIGVTQTITPDGVAVIWLPNAVLLAALLLTRPREWPLMAVAVLIAECIADIPAFPLWAAIAFGLANLFEAVLAATLIRRFAGSEFSFGSLRHLTIFLLAGPLLASSVAALLGASIYEVLDRTENTFLAFWRLWWLGNALGLLLLTPLVISAWQTIKAGKYSFEWRKLAELALIWAGIATTGFFLSGRSPEEDIQFHVTTVLLVPFAIWAATRFRILTTAATVSLISAIIVAHLVQGLHPDAATSPQYAVWVTQEYIAIVSIVALGLSALIGEIRHQRASIALQKRAMVASNDAVSIADVRKPDMPITWVNPKFEELFGYSAKEIVGRNMRILQKGCSQQSGVETIRRALADKKSCRVQLKNYTKAGKPLWIELSLAPVTDPNGAVTHYVGIQHDFTQEKETEQRLREATDALKRQNELLEEKVQERTQSLEGANSALNAANQKLKQIASTDFLTGIANRRHFYELSQRKLKRLGRDNRPAAMIAFDLDNFKAINDALGHEAGDEVLRRIVIPVENNIRPSDLFGRTGGEEFLLLIPGEAKDTAAAIAERIRSQIAETTVPYASHTISVTASFGVAEWDQTSDLDQFIRRADTALYQAKAEGRNRVCVS